MPLLSHFYTLPGRILAGFMLVVLLASTVSGPAFAAPSAADSAPSTPGSYDSAALDDLATHLQEEGLASGDGAAETTPREEGSDAAPLPEMVDGPRALAGLPKGAGDVSAQAIATPGGAGSPLGMGESFSAQLTTGTVSYSVPVALPAARGAAQPALALSYGSGAGFGLAGHGWSIGAAAISRQLDRGTPGYDDREDWHPEQDRFVFGASELVPMCLVSSGTCPGALVGELMPAWASGWQYFRARIEGSFLRFFWSPDHRTWRVQSKDGVTLELGVPLDNSSYESALEANPDDPAQIYRWYVVRQYDALGDVGGAVPAPVNAVQYRYDRQPERGNAVLLTDVYYTPPTSDPASAPLDTYAHHARLVYQSRPDQVVSFRSGWRMEHAERLARIDVTSMPFLPAAGARRELVRRYHLSYEEGLHTSLLSSVALEGRCETPVIENASGELPSSTCPRLPAQEFAYQRVTSSVPPLVDASGLAFEPLADGVQAIENSPPHSLDEELTSLADVNADGLPDVLVTAPGLFDGNHGVFLNSGTPNAPIFGPVMHLPVAGIDEVDAGVLRFDNPNVSALDYDADGRLDLVHMPLAKKYEVFSLGEAGGALAWVGKSVPTADAQDVKVDFSQGAQDTRVMDVNGDGLVDFVYSSPTEVQTFFSLGRYPGGEGQFGQARWTDPTTAEISNDPARHCAPWSASTVRFSDPDIQVAEMNGDGFPDIVRLRSGQVLYWPGRGNGMWGTGNRDDCPAGTFTEGRHVPMDRAPNFGVADAGALELADVNGDGLADVVEIRVDGVDVYLNDNGLAFTDRAILTGTPGHPNGTNPVRLSDINGSGTADILWGIGYDYRYIDLTGGIQPYLLSQVSNGLGKTLQLEYSTSAWEMLEAEAAGQPWGRVMPTVVPVIVRTRTRDHLEVLGLPQGEQIQEYSYRDPVFEGRQREFRGFSQAETRTLGDSSEPTSLERSTFQLGECPVAAHPELCAPENRWQDNWRDGLRGLPALVEVLDETGRYLSTSHVSYELRQLYAGRDGRRVVAPFAIGTDSYAYDTASFDGAETSVTLPEVQLELEDESAIESRVVQRRATAGTARLRTETHYDDLGQVTDSIRYGCVEGCPLGADEVITTHSEFGLPAGDTSGWLYREISSQVTGSAHTGPRKQLRHVHDAAGQRMESYATLSGTLPLDRRHSSGGSTAPAPTDASGGASAPVEIQLAEYTRDAFGNVTATRGPNGRCATFELDPDYADFVVADTVHGGPVAAGTGCGSRAFTTTATYDRGLQRPLSVLSMTGQPAEFVYDGFGQLIARTFADPAAPGTLASQPSDTTEYHFPADWSLTPYVLIVTRVQDGESVSASEYREQYRFVDGLGRPIATLSEADPDAGDQGEWVVAGPADYSAKGSAYRTYLPWFWSGSPTAYDLGTPPPTQNAAAARDAFGRITESYGLDGEIEQSLVHHALSVDQHDAEDIGPGLHQGTPTTVVHDGHARPRKTTFRVHAGATIEERNTLTTYLPTGEPERITQQRTGSTDIVRWFQYDTLGRLVLNAEPNTSPNFTTTPSTSVQAWRYAYNDAGDLVCTSDARGCGANFHHDAIGRLIAEDYSPCASHQPAYSSPNLTTGDGTETFVLYDALDPDTPGISDPAGTRLDPNVLLLWGRVASVSDRAQKSVFRYDALGQTTGVALRVAPPGAPNNTLASRYAPRWYLQTTELDAAGRPVASTTGATVAELLGTDGQSRLTHQYSRRGVLTQVAGSYGPLVTARTLTADGLPDQTTLGDSATTERHKTYDLKRRLARAETFRAAPSHWTSPPSGYTPPTQTGTEPTAQLLLEDTSVTYDRVGNILTLTDLRTPEEWPTSAKPVSRTFTHDDLYRVTSAAYAHSGGDTWQSPYAAENTTTSRSPQPSPHVSFSTRVHSQSWSYDWLGNLTASADDANGFYDRSLGTQTHGTSTSGPHRLLTASNRSTSSPRRGDLATAYDAAGNLTDLVVKREGTCLPTGASCWQRYRYQWDELSRLTKAQRWDLTGAERTSNATPTSPVPARTANIDLRHAYSASGDRVLKTSVTASATERHTVYLFPTLELRQAQFTGGDYELSATTAQVRLFAPGVAARVVYAQEDLPSLTSGQQHVLLELGDHLGSATTVLDKATGEVVEYRTYQAYGEADADYRPARWAHLREPYGFTGKEADIEVGLVYFGARYYSPALMRWVSPDPVTVHAAAGDLNPYAYVNGRVVVSVDPRGELPFLAAAILLGAVIGGALSGASYAVTRSPGTSNWGKGLAIAIGAGAVGGAIAGVSGAAVAQGIQAPFWSAVAGGAVAGGTGAASTYLATAGISAVAGEPSDWSLCGGGSAFSLCGLGLSTLAGAAMGAATGAAFEGVRQAGWKQPPEGPAKFRDAPDRTFKTRDDAARWGARRFGDRSYVQGREYGASIYKNPDGAYSLGDIYVGTDTNVNPLVDMGPGQEYGGYWHTHPRGAQAEQFSRGAFIREGHDPVGYMTKGGGD